MLSPNVSSQDTFDRMAAINQKLVALLRSKFQEKLRAAGLAPLFKNGAPALVYLHRNGRSILRDIAAGCGQQAAALTWTAQQLEQLKLVVRGQDSADKRFYHLELTELGKQYAVLAQEARADVAKSLFGRMTETQRVRFEQVLLLLQSELEGDG